MTPMKFEAAEIHCDIPLLVICAFLVVFGLLMVASSSLELATEEFNGDAFHYLIRQLIYLVISGIVAYCVYLIGMRFWITKSRLLFCFAAIVLCAVLLIGTEVYGGRRWLMVGGISVQPSEFAKLALILFIADHIGRHGAELRTSFAGFSRPMVAAGGLAVLVLLEPDFGTMVVMMTIAVGMLFLAGAKLWHFILSVAGLALAAASLILMAPYRWARWTGFLDPWQERYDQGYQLVQSLVAIGSGSWFGAGLGESMQKLFYLPKAHTDFIFSIIAEEMGFIGVAIVVACYFGVVFRCFKIANHAEQQKMRANAYVAYGVGIWIGLQAFINIAVAMGLLPTKGITLPFVSVGGSSLLAVFIAVAMVQRIYMEACYSDKVLVRRYERRQREVAYG